MSNRIAYLLFGDQSLDTHAFFADFCRQSPGLLSRHFLNLANIALQKEIDQLPASLRSTIPTFSTIQQLNQRYFEGSKKHAGIDSALLVASQLAHYIDRSEKTPEDQVPSSKAVIVGLCTGLLSAAAVALAPSLTSLPEIAAQFVLVAFRTGQYVAGTASLLQTGSTNSDCWTYVLPGLTEADVNDMLEEYNESKSAAKACQVYISAVTPKSIAVSGPPCILNEFLASGNISCKPLPLSVHGPYHARHLHSQVDVDVLLGLYDTRVAELFAHHAIKATLLSCSTGLPFSVKEGTLDVLRNILRDILLEPLNFQRILSGCVTRSETLSASQCLIIPLGTTSAAAPLATLLKTQTDLDIAVRKVSRSKSADTTSRAGDHGSSRPVKLAIVGMAGRFPDAASHEKLWELLEKGLDVHRKVPADRFDAVTHVDVTGKGQNKSHTPYGCWIENPGLFDPRFFNMSPREAYQTCPMQRLALSTCYEALEMSGYVPNRTRSTKLDRIGTFYGQTSDDWREINAAQDVDTYYITGGVRAFGPGRINYHFGFSGPSFSIDTACSSSMAAMQLACTSLWAGDCDTAIVGGMSCMTNSDIFSGLSKGQFLSKTGPCATFDNDADGYCRADGIGTVIVKRLEDAMADNDNVLGVILGTATNHSADAISITHPHGLTQEALYKDILNMSGIDPLDVDYVEMHGTGTQAGDGTEMLSVTNVFAPAERKRSAQQPLYLGAVKANIGHGEAASGITALIKCLMMLQKSAIPPHVGIKNTINKGFPKDLSERNVNIAFHKTPLLKKKGQPRTIYISNFSAAGGNSGLLIQDGTKEDAVTPDSRTTHIVTVTAKSKSALLRNIKQLDEFLDQNTDIQLSDLSYTTTARRIQHNWRAVVFASTVQEARSALVSKPPNTYSPIPQVAPKVAFLFTGQGSHYASLGKELYEKSTFFHSTISSYNDLAILHGFPAFLGLVDGTLSDVQSLSPILVQLAVVCSEMALFELWTSWGIKAGAVMGHSLGEYAALFAAGVLSASDTIYLVGSRAQLLVEKCSAGTHAMLAVKGEAASVTAALSQHDMQLNIACINGPGETVISGDTGEIESAFKVLQAAGFKSTTLKVPYAFHSAQVDPILDDFEQISASVKFNKANVPVISPLLGRVIRDVEGIDSSYLRQHARQPVDFLGGLHSAQEAGITDDKTVWLEVGPHSVCVGMVRATFGHLTVTASTLKRSESPYATISSSIATMFTAGVDIDWNEYHREYLKSLHLLDLPAYSFDDKNYWLQYSGDWCLTKGRAVQANQLTTETLIPTLSTTSVHRVVEQTSAEDTATVTIETDILAPGIKDAVMGHLCNGTPLCPSSIYADMALTLCDYAYKLIKPDTKDAPGMDVCHMEVVKPLIAKPELKSQLLRVTVNIDLKQSKATLRYFSETPKVDHASCQVILGDKQKWLSEWERNTYLIRSRIDHLKMSEKSGTASKIGRGLAYKLFATFVNYDPKYRGMEEVILGPDMEATSKVVFQTAPADGTFFCSPYWIDSVAHISGFIVNATDATDSAAQVYVSHGWESMRIAEPLSSDKTYRSYVKMQPTTGTMVAGDVFVFEGERIIAVVGGLKFQAIPRSLLNMFLPPPGASTEAAPTPKALKVPPKIASAPRTKSVIETTQVTMKNLQVVNKKLDSITSLVLAILAAEVGVGIDELVDNIAFTDLGVDSLMSLTVSGRIREELEIDIQSSMFNDHPTIGQFKKLLQTFESQARSDSSSSSSGSEDIMDETTPELDDSSPISTPDDFSIADTEKADGSGGMSDLIRTTIAGEMGISIDEIADHSDLTTMGMDSLMSLTILGSLREQTGIDLPSDLFTVNATIQQIEKALHINKAPPPPATISKVASSVRIGDSLSIAQKPLTTERQATSVLLQGRVRTATKQLWIVPDGSGSATSYVEIPNILPDMAVWGLNSPYMKNPEEFNNGVIGIASKYITEMKLRQPKGPYMLAGWSAGGVIAFECTKQLLKAGDVVEHLVLLDTPCPLTIEPLPSSLHRWFASIGLLGDGDPSSIPPWLLPHFASSVTALSNYTATEISPKLCPLVTVIWCEDGVCKLPTDPKPDPYPYGHAQWLLENRTDFGPNLWDTYIPREKMVMKTLEGNHFSMMKGAEAKQLGNLIREGLTRAS